VILLSDGLANRGITSPWELNRMAEEYRSRAISLTTMGVGLEYNENLMVGLAGHGGGNYYFIERSDELASMFRREFNLLSSVVAQNAVLELTLERGVRLLDAIGCEVGERSRVQTISLGDLSANEVRELTLELEVPGGHGKHIVASGRVAYETERGTRYCPQSFAAAVYYVTDLAEVERHRDMEVQAKADIALSTRAVEKGMRALDEGRPEEAARQLSAAKDAIAASPAAASGGSAGSMVKEQEGRLKAYIELFEDKNADVRKVKKSVQYENYRVQKKN
jgi:Ca-activated chloride channel family protein